MVQRSVEEVGKAMLNTTILGRRETRLVVATTITLLLALAALAAQASPAFAADPTLTVAKTGMGTVTSDPAGIDCGTDCSEPYPSSTEEICIEYGPCNTITTYQNVTLTAAPAPGWAFQSWSGDCSGTATTCTLTVNGNESVNATFIRISPPNDDFAAAQLISGASASVNGTTKDATRQDPDEPRHSAAWAGEHTVWYSWTAPHTGEWNIDTCQANIDSILAVYTGGQLGALTKVKDDNNGCPNNLDGSTNFGSKLTFRATAGTTYRIVVGDAGGAMQNTFTFALNAIPAPPNDNFDNAQVISGASASVNGTNVSATRESSDPWSGTQNAERSVWYRWTAPFSGSATVDTCTTNYDTLLSVSTSRSFGLINDNGCSSGFGSKLTFDAQKDQTLYIGVDGCCGLPAGTFTLALDLVDDVAPQTSILSGPEDGSALSSTSLTFEFDADEPGSTFECRVYPAALTPPAFDNCSGAGTHTASGFNAGTYTFEVRATDAAGNPDATPAKRTFSIDTSKPTVETWNPKGKKQATPKSKPYVTFSEKMDEASVEESANGKPTTFILKKGTKKVGASVTYVETTTGPFTATLKPDKKLQRGATYTASVTTAAKDEAGNAVVARTWKFRVKP